MLDYHVHLWPHGKVAEPSEHRLERLARYVEDARAKGVTEIALTEHFFRFRAGRDCVGPFWDAEPDGRLRGAIAAYYEAHCTADLDDYVEAVLEAQAAGLPVRLGLEVDYYRGQMDDVSRLLSGYPFDVLLGSVHWIGTWMFDDLGSEVACNEWDRRGIEEAWRSYTEALEELAATRTCDVLAHPDVIKLTGARPDPVLLADCQDRMAAAAARAPIAAELSSAGFRKPVGEQYPSTDLLRKFFVAGVGLTTASDTHGISDIASRHSELVGLAHEAGYRSLSGFSGRVAHEVPLRLDTFDTAR